MGFEIGSTLSWCSGFAKSSNGRINEYGFTKLRAYIRTDPQPQFWRDAPDALPQALCIVQ